jgi:hypothetical protein
LKNKKASPLGLAINKKLCYNKKAKRNRKGGNAEYEN